MNTHTGTEETDAATANGESQIKRRWPLFASTACKIFNEVHLKFVIYVFFWK
jgi:hypothetical protein